MRLRHVEKNSASLSEISNRRSRAEFISSMIRMHVTNHRPISAFDFTARGLRRSWRESEKFERPGSWVADRTQ